jgi:hypothetical protein
MLRRSYMEQQYSSSETRKTIITPSSCLIGNVQTKLVGAEYRLWESNTRLSRLSRETINEIIFSPSY